MDAPPNCGNCVFWLPRNVFLSRTRRDRGECTNPKQRNPLDWHKSDGCGLHEPKPSKAVSPES
jgi:hypothetical protein